MSISKATFCACCQTLITAPQFYNGKAYGYTCITKVVPTFKRKRDSGLWIAADSVTHEREGAMWVKSTAVVDGYKFTATRPIDRGVFNRTGEIVPNADSDIQNGMLRVAKNKNGSNTIWNSLDVITDRDSKGKLFPVKVVKYLLAANKQVDLATF